jgi:hypothetical protein
MCLTGYAAVTTSAAQQGLGRHIEAVAAENPQNVVNVGLLAHVAQVLAVMACTLGKTAFAVTLLRILTQRWIIWVIWFIIVTMNLVNFLTCFFVFLQCKNPRHLWNPAITSECWDPSVFTNFSLFVGGKYCRCYFAQCHTDTSLHSIFRLPRLCSCIDPLVRCSETADEEEGEDRHRHCYELGSLVRIPHAPLDLSLT